MGTFAADDASKEPPCHGSANQFFNCGLLGWQLHCHPGKTPPIRGGSTTATPTPVQRAAVPRAMGCNFYCS